MKSRTGRTTRTFTVSFPPELAAQVESLASEEHRTTSELFREAFRSYRAARISKVFAELEKQTNTSAGHEFGPEDVERSVAEFRRKRSTR